MAVIALALYAAWAMTAYGLRTIVQIRETGDNGFRRPQAPLASLEWVASALFVLALVVGVIAPIADLASWVEPVGVLTSAALQTLGVVVAIVGIVATFLAQVAMGASWRIGVDPSERTDLVTGGVFAVVRNPIFSAMLVTAAGLALVLPNVIALVGLAALVIAMELQVRGVEEPYLRKMHGPAYAEYTSRVGRFVPGFGRAAKAR